MRKATIALLSLALFEYSGAACARFIQADPDGVISAVRTPIAPTPNVATMAPFNVETMAAIPGVTPPTPILPMIKTPRPITAADVLEYHGLNHSYAYVDGNPISNVDPEGTQITFGHGARHLGGVSPSLVQQAIGAQVRPILPYTTPGAGFWGTVNVGGSMIVFRAMPLPGGACHIGTYYPR